MDTHELSANLPSPLDDEPPSLRQDILDELADHLQCALRREMLTKDDEATAQKRVLDKFGDPREVARKLWVQAMWSKIMSQRITLGLLTLTTVACLALAGMTWQTTRQNQQANAALLDQIAKLVEANRTPAPTPPAPDATLTVRLFNGKKGRSLSKSATVAVEGTHLQNASVKGAQTSDESGVAEFGVLPPGAYRIDVRTVRGITKRTVKVPWGEARIEEIICPDDELRRDSINIACELPDDLNEKNIVALAVFDPEPLEFEGNTWLPSAEDSITVVVTQRGSSIMHRTPSAAREFQGFPIDTLQRRSNWIQNLISRNRGRPETSSARRHWTGTRFRLSRVALVTDPEMQSELVRQPRPAGRAVTLTAVAVRTMKGDADWPAELDVDYVVAEGKPWHITIPNRLIEEARTQLAEPTAEKPGPQ